MSYLASILQNQLATDRSALQNIDFIISILEPSHFIPSSHLSRWVTRINSLLHAKEPASRWCGLCLAEKSAEMCHDLLMENAQAWVGLALPLLSRNDVLPIYKASIHLLLRLFSSSMMMPEFQRQVSSPNVPKFASSLISLSEQNSDQGLRLIIIKTLSSLCQLYPSLMKAQQTHLYKVSLADLSGSQPARCLDLVRASAILHAHIHYTGGKVGGSGLWRKSLDSALGTASECIRYLRSTFTRETTERLHARLDHPPIPQDAVIGIPSSLDRLRCTVLLICTLMSSPTVRAVALPMGEMARLTATLLQLPNSAMDESHFDPLRRNMEIAVSTSVVEQGCILLGGLAICAREHLTPYSSQLLDVINYNLRSSSLVPQYRTLLLDTIPILVYSIRPFHSTLVPSALCKTVLPSVTKLVGEEPRGNANTETNNSDPSVSRRKGKKRARGYEGDEVFKKEKGSYRLTFHESDEALAAIDALSCLAQSGLLAPSTLSTLKKVFLSLLLRLPDQDEQLLSPDPTVHGKLITRITKVCTELETSGNGGWNAPTLGTVVSTVTHTQGGALNKPRFEIFRGLEQIIHPHYPPLLRSLPPIEAMSFTFLGESKEERELQESLGLHSEKNPAILPNGQDTERIPSNPIIVTPEVPRAEPHPTVTMNPSGSEPLDSSSMASQPSQVAPTTFSSFGASIASSAIPPSSDKPENSAKISLEPSHNITAGIIAPSSFI
ncbi:hypothetical protein FRC03_005682, partial [Tulasnella sp. 419]